MNFKTLLASLLTCLFVLTNLNASEISQSKIVESETVEVMQEKSYIKTNAPRIIGASNKTIEVGSYFNPMAGVTATDIEGGDITKNIQISGLDKLNTNVAGTYTLKYAVYDSNYNLTSVNRVITVINKSVTPDPNKVTFSGVSDKSIDYKSKFDIRSGVSAKDSNGKDVPFTVTGTVNTSKPNIYKLTYKAGSTTVTRNITVKNTSISTYNNEKLVTYYDKNGNKYKAELFYTSGEKHADYTYNDKSWVTYTEYDKNGNKISYQSRYDNLRMKEKAEYHTNGKTKRMYNFYDTGRKSMYRTWNEQGIKTNQIQYYNQANSMKSVDYAYYADGKVSEYVKRYSNGKMKERKWYYSNGKVKRTDDFYDNGRKKMHRTWNSSGAKTNQIEYYNQTNSMKSVDYAYYENGKTREFVKRYSNGKTKERRWYYSNGKTKRSDNYYSNGRKSMYRTWNSSGVKTDHREYYNQSNTQIKADYAYYDNGKVSEFIKWKSNGKRIEHVWIYKNGDRKNYKRIKRYNSNGQVYSDKSYNDRTLTNNKPIDNNNNNNYPTDEELAIEIEKEINRVRQEKGVGTLKTDNKVLDGLCQKTVDEFVKTGNPHPGYIYHSPEVVMNDKLLISTNAAWAGNRFNALSVVQGWTDSPGHYNTQFREGEEYLDVKVKTTSSGQYVEACYGKTDNP